MELLTKKQEKHQLYVFVGEKIEVSPAEFEVEEGSFCLDYAFIAKYRILECIYGKFEADTIDFIAYDHYGTPNFSNYQYVLLYVVDYKGKYIHSKYQYSSLFKAKDGRWAGPYSHLDYLHAFNKDTKIKPEIIEFKQEAAIDLSVLKKEHMDYYFPSPYYKIKNNKAFVIYGNYINELFHLKKDGVLKARGYFK